MSYFANIKKDFKWKYFISYIVIAAALIICIVLNELGILSRSIIGLLVRISYSVILAVSLNLVVGFLGELSLGHAGFMCVGAYLGCYAASLLHGFIGSDLLVLIISILIGGLSAALFGFLIGLPALRLKGDYLAIVTLAFGEIVRNIFKNLEVFGGARGMTTVIYPTAKLFIVGFAVVLIVLALIQHLIRSKHGRAITSIRDNEIAARAMGINVTFYKIFVFVVSAAFAGMAGVLYGHYTSPVLPTFFSYNYSIEILVMVVLGGIGSLNGSIIAATLITVVNFLLQNTLSGDLAALKYLFYAAILIVVVLFTNAPGLQSIREKLNIKRLIAKLRPASPEVIKDDEAAWHRIKTKINMDEILSVDTEIQSNAAYTPDKPQKGGRSNG